MVEKTAIRWDKLLAARTERIHASVYDKFGAIPDHLDMIRFSDGAPAPECYPLERMRDSIQRAWHESPPALGYGEPEGYLPLREVIAGRMRRRGVAVSPDEVLIINGAQQGLELAARLLLEPGDRVIVEGPTYFGALQVFDHYGVDYDVVPIDEQGIDPVALERALRRQPAPKLMYLIPTYQNPTGVSLSPERRKQVIDLSHRYNVPILEDDPYADIWFERDLGPLRALDPDVIYLGTFSKTLAPALRMGWMVAPPALMRLLIDTKEAVDMQADRLLQRAVVYTLEDGWLDEHMERVRPIYRARRDQLLAQLEREMPGDVRWTEPLGGFFVWVTLPGEQSADELLRRAAHNGVRYYSGSAFYPDVRERPTFRLGYSTLPEDRIAEGIRRLGRTLRERE